MLMSSNEDEVTVHGCYRLGDIRGACVRYRSYRRVEVCASVLKLVIPGIICMAWVTKMT